LLISATIFLQVYANLQPQAFFLRLANNGAGLASAWEAITRLEAAISVLNIYYAIDGICILLLIARCVCRTVTTSDEKCNQRAGKDQQLPLCLSLLLCMQHHQMC
jgi:hypothetical protein